MELNSKLSIARGVLFRLLVVKCLGDTNSSCSLATAQSPLLRLKKHLFCDYDNTVRAIMHHKNTTKVAITFSPMRIDFIDKSSRFILHTWANWVWTDEFLIWSPKDFDGVEITYVKSTEIWMPDFSLYNSADMTETQIGMSNVPCLLRHTGELTCIAPVKYDTHCITDFTNWPYDEQTCKMHIGSWVHVGEDVGIDFNKSSINMDNYYKNDEWDIKEYTFMKNATKYACCPDETYLEVTPVFIMWRYPSTIHTIYVTSTYVFAVITLLTLYLDSRSTERILLATMNFGCHALFIYTLHWVLPNNGEKGSPYLLIFYRDSWVIATFTIAITMLLRRLQSCKETPPKWIVLVGSLVARNRISRFLLLAGKMEDSCDIKQLVSIDSHSLRSNEDEGEVNNSLQNLSFRNLSKSRANDSWRRVAIIVEKFAFICVAFTNLLLVILLVPRAQSEYVKKV